MRKGIGGALGLDAVLSLSLPTGPALVPRWYFPQPTLGFGGATGYSLSMGATNASGVDQQVSREGMLRMPTGGTLRLGGSGFFTLRIFR